MERSEDNTASPTTPPVFVDDTGRRRARARRVGRILVLGFVGYLALLTAGFARDPRLGPLALPTFGLPSLGLAQPAPADLGEATAQTAADAAEWSGDAAGGQGSTKATRAGAAPPSGTSRPHGPGGGGDPSGSPGGSLPSSGLAGSSRPGSDPTGGGSDRSGPAAPAVGAPSGSPAAPGTTTTSGPTTTTHPTTTTTTGHGSKPSSTTTTSPSTTTTTPTAGQANAGASGKGPDGTGPPGQLRKSTTTTTLRRTGG